VAGCGRPNCLSRDQVLVRVTANGVTPLDQTILSGGHPRAKAPLVLSNEGALVSSRTPSSPGSPWEAA
jgi:Zn-dependent alcohol dehydrogenase